MLPDRIGRNDHRKANQQQDLREAEAIKTALGEALDKRIGCDWAFHGSPALAVQGLVYALIDPSPRPVLGKALFLLVGLVLT
jgi:hypothetical protein